MFNFFKRIFCNHRDIKIKEYDGQPCYVSDWIEIRCNKCNKLILETDQLRTLIKNLD